MKKTLMGVALLGVAFVMTSATASASGLCAFGQNILQDYIGNPITAPSGGLQATSVFNCTIGEQTFQNFSYNLSTGTFATSTVQVNLQAAGVIGGQDIFQFDPNLSASSDMLLEFQVTGGVAGVDLSTAITGTGFVNETLCTIFTSGGVCPAVDAIATLNISGNGSNAEFLVVSTGLACGAGCTTSTTSGIDQVNFGTAESQIWVIKDINTGDAAYSEIEQSFIPGSVVPEPVTFSLMGAGLLGLGLLGRRRLRK